MRTSRLFLAVLSCAALLGPAAGFAQSAAPAAPAPTAAPVAPVAAAPAAAPASGSMRGMKMPAGTPSVVNINTASAADLDKLPQIGRARSAKIIKNRPYATTEDLLTKKVLPKGVFERIKSMVTTG
jgi:DNA uptake protein ComE-like DNA-binding protein